MITKERLEELIEQGATIYTTRYSYASCGIILDDKHFEVNDKYLVFTYKAYEILLEDLFEAEEEAKWYIEFGCIERTERLVLPTWEEIKHDFIDNKRELGNYAVCEFDDCSIDIVVCCTGDIMISIYEINFYKELTKENYTLACRKAKELFLGEKK